MDMYAAGFNAWNQLSFEPRPGDNDEPQDFSAFTKVLTDDHLERPRAGLHYTLGETKWSSTLGGSLIQKVPLTEPEGFQN
jgi:hypothetical protein